VLVGAGQDPPAPWAAAPRVVLDDEALAGPGGAVARLHAGWAQREPLVLELRIDPAVVRAPRTHPDEPWRLGPGFEVWHDRLHFLLWANTYDARAGGEPVWWWARKAERLGAVPAGVDRPGDVLLPDGTAAWIDGGPRTPLPVPLAGAQVVHRESVEVGRLVPQPPPVAPRAALAGDQLDAVGHRSGPARIVAPAGSGKTRVLTERLRHVLADRGYERETTLALAYNKKAQEEMASRLPGLGARIQTLNAWGYGLLARAWGRRPDLLDEREVRSIVERLVPAQRRRVNTDPLAPYLDGLSLIRLGLRDPAAVEAELEDVPGLAAAHDAYRSELRRRGAIDFDEQVYAAAEALLQDGELRRQVQADHRHLLVDELQDLTPAHVLLVRLAAAPGFDVFGVGDDDQCIYGHAGADPRFLIDYDRFFPGGGHHALEVNYRCPAAVTTAAATLLSYNDRRVAKEIRPGPEAAPEPEALVVRPHAGDAGASALVGVVAGWLEGGAAPAQVAVLTRVQSLLLAPHVALAEAGVAVDSILDEGVLGRLGLRGALAYLRIALEPDRVDGRDLSEVHRRPSRGLPQWATKFLDRCRSVGDVRRAAGRIDDVRVGEKLEALASDLDGLAQLARGGATSRDLLTSVRDEIGLGSAMTLLDSSGGASASHLDDLEALLQVADLHPDAATFEAWLRRTFHRQRAQGGVVLSTIHRVKGLEWDHVALFGITDGIVPHRLADDVEEERRVLHVGVTRGRRRVVVLGDRGRPSPFLGELDGSAPRDRVVPGRARPQPTERAAPRRPDGPPSLPAEVGVRVSVLGGYAGEIAAVGADGIRLAVDGGGSFAVRYGERVQVDGSPRILAPPTSPLADRAAAALRAWRSERARADGVPAYVVLNDKHLDGIAARHPTDLGALRSCPGIGPAKLDTYGEEILAVLAGVADAG
jgi:DNA helicase II / ATP-dependent DNA helicase PcrA